MKCSAFLILLLLPLIGFGADLVANITVLDFFTTTDLLLGMYADGYHINGIDHVNDEIESYHYNGTPYLNIPIDYAANPNPWGFCVVPAVGNYFTDFASSSIHYYASGVWQSFVDPAGILGRGLCFDGSYLWEADGDFAGDGNGVYRLNTDGTGAIFFPTPEPQSYLSGIVRFSYAGEEYVMVTAMGDFNFYFYTTSGEFAGSEPIPVTVSSVYGIDYSDNDDIFFLSCLSYGNRCIYKFDFEFALGLETNTFAGVKRAFR